MILTWVASCAAPDERGGARPPPSVAARSVAARPDIEPLVPRALEQVRFAMRLTWVASEGCGEAGYLFSRGASSLVLDVARSGAVTACAGRRSESGGQSAPDGRPWREEPLQAQQGYAGDWRREGDQFAFELEKAEGPCAHEGNPYLPTHISLRCGLFTGTGELAGARGPVLACRSDELVEADFAARDEHDERWVFLAADPGLSISSDRGNPWLRDQLSVSTRPVTEGSWRE